MSMRVETSPVVASDRHGTIAEVVTSVGQSMVADLVQDLPRMLQHARHRLVATSTVEAVNGPAALVLVLEFRHATPADLAAMERAKGAPL
jgi:hypothetical protein